MTNRKRLIAVAVVVALAALASTATAYFVRQSRLNTACVRNVKVIGTALEASADSAKGASYPVLSVTRGCIVLEANGLYPSYLSDPSLPNSTGTAAMCCTWTDTWNS